MINNSYYLYVLAVILYGLTIMNCRAHELYRLSSINRDSGLIPVCQQVLGRIATV